MSINNSNRQNCVKYNAASLIYLSNDVNGVPASWNYYPYGSEMTMITPSQLTTNPDWQAYRFSGKELIRQNGLNMYDFGARLFDVAGVPMWTSMDPLCEKYYHLNPYMYCAGDPVNLFDPDGEKPSIAEAARIAAHVYGGKDEDLIGGWKVSENNLQNIITNKYGLDSKLYERTVDGVTEYVYATAGTNPFSYKDWAADVAQVFGRSKQYQYSVENAENLTNELVGQEITFVGHSLGGGEAALNALVTGREAITFNPAGLSSKTLKKNNLEKTEAPCIEAYIMRFDPLNLLQSNTGLPNADGKVNKIPSNKNIFKAHKISSIVDYLKK